MLEIHESNPSRPLIFAPNRPVADADPDPDVPIETGGGTPDSGTEPKNDDTPPPPPPG